MTALNQPLPESIAAGAFSPPMVVVAPFLLLLQLFTAPRIGPIFAALNAQYRDVKHVVPFLLMMDLFVTGLQPLGVGSNSPRRALSFNPRAAVMDSRRALSTDQPRVWIPIAKQWATAIALLNPAAGFFKVRVKRMVDIP